MIPFRFGAVEHQLYGVFHPGSARRQPTLGALLCNPFGQEAVRTHRMYRVLAERLCQAGIHVLRFDYYATGESAGEDGEGEMERWCDDVVAADLELRQRAMCSQTVWVGARLGGSLAALASARSNRAPDRLVLWEPVTDGQRYLDHLADSHAKAIRYSYSYNDVPDSVPTMPRGEAIGFVIGDVLERQLRQLKESAYSTMLSKEAVIISNAHNGQTADMIRQFGSIGVPSRVIPFEHAFDWTSEEAFDTALVPADALQLLASQITVADT